MFLDFPGEYLFAEGSAMALVSNQIVSAGATKSCKMILIRSYLIPTDVAYYCFLIFCFIDELDLIFLYQCYSSDRVRTITKKK